MFTIDSTVDSPSIMARTTYEVSSSWNQERSSFEATTQGTAEDRGSSSSSRLARGTTPSPSVAVPPASDASDASGVFGASDTPDTSNASGTSGAIDTSGAGSSRTLGGVANGSMSSELITSTLTSISGYIEVGRAAACPLAASAWTARSSASRA